MQLGYSNDFKVDYALLLWDSNNIYKNNLKIFKSGLNSNIFYYYYCIF